MRSLLVTLFFIISSLTACISPVHHINPRPPAHGQLQNAKGCNAQTGRC